MTFASLVLSVGAVWAQEVKVSGTVTDAAGEPLVGVYVLIQGYYHRYFYRNRWRLHIGCSCNGTLVYSLMGMKDAVEPVNNRASINVVMQEGCGAARRGSRNRSR